MGKAGKILLGAGLGAAVLGGVLLDRGASAAPKHFEDSRRDKSWGLQEFFSERMMLMGGLSMGSGGLCVLVGIPLIIFSSR
jgi:hypothetical protein